MLDHFFPFLFPKDYEPLKIFDIRLQEVGAKRPLNGTSKVNRRTDGHTDGQTDGHFDLQKASAPRADALKIPGKMKQHIYFHYHSLVDQEWFRCKRALSERYYWTIKNTQGSTQTDQHSLRKYLAVIYFNKTCLEETILDIFLLR